MKTVVLTTRLFDQPGNGGELGTERLLIELERAGHDLLVIGRGTAPQDRAQRRYLSVAPGVEPFDSLATMRQVGLVLRALLGRQASTVQRLASSGVGRIVERVLADQAAKGIDCLIVDHLQVIGWLDRSRLLLPAPMLLMHNLESEVQLGQANLPGRGVLARARRRFRMREARLLEKLEVEAVLRAGAIACIAQSDASALRSIARDNNAPTHIEVLPAYPLRAIPSRVGLRNGALNSAGAPRRIGMIGTWTWSPNRTALLWFLEQVLPQLPAHCSLVLAGSGLDGFVLPSRVRALGRVDHASELYDQVDLVAVPSITGSGIQEKALDALCSGRPVVATRHALRGIDDALPPHILVAEGCEDFVALCAYGSLALPIDAALAVDAWVQARRRGYSQALAACLAAAGSAGPGQRGTIRARSS